MCYLYTREIIQLLFFLLERVFLFYFFHSCIYLFGKAINFVATKKIQTKSILMSLKKNSISL